MSPFQRRSAFAALSVFIATTSFACIRTDWQRPAQDSQPNTLSISENAFFAEYEEPDSGWEGGTTPSLMMTITVVADRSCAPCGELTISRDGTDIVRLNHSTPPSVHLVTPAWGRGGWVSGDAGDESLTTTTFPIEKRGAKLGARSAASKKCSVRIEQSDRKANVSCSR